MDSEASPESDSREDQRLMSFGLDQAKASDTQKKAVTGDTVVHPSDGDHENFLEHRVAAHSDSQPFGVSHIRRVTFHILADMIFSIAFRWKVARVPS